MLGRDINRSPISISGRNSIGYCLEVVGNFEKEGEGSYNNLGYDEPTPEQWYSWVKINNFVKNELGWDIVFHNEYSNKTCPAIDKTEFLKEVERMDNPNIVFLGKKINCKSLVNENGVTKVELRDLFESIGFKVGWNEENKIVTIDLK